MDTPCVEWQGGRSSGYGILWDKQTKQVKLAHRKAWEDHHGPIPPGMRVLHGCDNPPCINVDHLSIGTQKDNIQDALSKGRMRGLETHHWSKLTNEQVYEIRESKEPTRFLAERYGCSKTNIKDIRRRRTWRMLPER